jgi:hypothetical protein
MQTIRVRAGLMLAGLAGLAAATCLPALAQERSAFDERALVDRRVRDWQPTAAERRLDDIAWAHDLRAALRLGREHHRPIFVFTYSGCAEREHAIALQRC